MFKPFTKDEFQITTQYDYLKAARVFVLNAELLKLCKNSVVHSLLETFLCLQQLVLTMDVEVRVSDDAACTRSTLRDLADPAAAVEASGVEVAESDGHAPWHGKSEKWVGFLQYTRTVLYALQTTVLSRESSGS